MSVPHGTWVSPLGKRHRAHQTQGGLSADRVARLNELFHLLPKMTILMSGFIWVINVIVGRDSSVPAGSVRQPACKTAEWKDLRENRLQLERKANGLLC